MKNYKYILIAIGMLLAFSLTASASLSFKELVANRIDIEKLTDKLIDKLFNDESVPEGYTVTVSSGDCGGEECLGKASGYAHWQHESFLQGLSGGARDQFSVSNAGVITSSGTFTQTGATILSSTLSVGGMFTYSPAVNATTSMANSATLTEAELLASQYFEASINTPSDLTWTLPASTTMTTFLANAGESSTICFYNATSSAYNLIFAAGTGIDLEKATSTLNIYPQTTGCLKFIRKVDTDVTALFGNFVD